MNHSPKGTCVGNYGCSRPECVRADRRYKKQARTGRFALVPIGPVADHFDRLRAAGMSMGTIERESGVDPTTLARIAARSARTVRQATAVRIYSLAPRADRAGTETALRQVRALYALGYPVDYLRTAARWAGLTPFRMPAEVHRSRLARLDALTRTIGDTPGPSERARREAARRGWLIPAWYDETWEDPTETLAATSVEDARVQEVADRRAERAALAVERYRAGLPIVRIVDELRMIYGTWGTSARAVHRYVAEAGAPRRSEKHG